MRALSAIQAGAYPLDVLFRKRGSNTDYRVILDTTSEKQPRTPMMPAAHESLTKLFSWLHPLIFAFSKPEILGVVSAYAFS